MLCGSLLLVVTAAMQSSTVIRVSGQNTTNLSLTESELENPFYGSSKNPVV
jgi:hypothetical protein